MSNAWVAAPRVRPHICHACKRGGAENGPYFEDDFHYLDHGGAECRLYTCHACFVNAMQAPGSPIEESQANHRREIEVWQAIAGSADGVADELRAQLDEAEGRIKVLEDEAAGRQVFAELVAGHLEERLGLGAQQKAPVRRQRAAS